MLSVSSVFDAGVFTQQGHEQLILNHLAESEQTAYLQKGAYDLQLVDVDQNDQGQVSVFQQTMDGLPVFGSFVTVTQGTQGDVQSVNNRTFSQVGTEDTLKPALSLGHAQQIANEGLDQRIEIASDGQLVWFHSGQRAELGWHVITTAVGADVNNADIALTTVIDANTGNILTQSQSTVGDGSVGNPDTGIHARIVINDTIGPAGSRAYAAPFDSVVDTPGCTGTLIAPNVVISARHCGTNTGATINFGDNSGSPIHTATVQSSSLPAGNGSLLDGGDVSILTLTSNVPSNIAEPMRLIDATNELVGMTAATLGYGFNGVGSSGHGNTSDGWRWGGENIIDVYGTPASASGSNIISTDFDDGSAGANTIPSSSATPLQFEATTAPGDSGGPVFVQLGSEWVIAGVLSGGTTGNSVYGDISWWTGTAIYRAQIEAAGGVFADGGLGTVGFDQESYFIDDTVTVTVLDSNASNPVSVTIVSDSGDSETLSLTNGGSGTTFTGSIVTSDAGVSTEDGTLQVSNGDDITVTYIDADDGTGNSNTVNDTAVVLEPAEGALTGIDFGEPGSPTPSNWDLITGGGNATFSNLNDENGDATVIDLAVAELTDGTWSDFAVTPAANTIPQHLNSLTNIESQIYTGADPLQLTYSDLTPGNDYEIYVMSAEGFFSSIEQTVTITGEGAPVSFDQIFNSDQLFVNAELGDSTRTLQSYAQVITADASGEIVIDITPIAGTDDVVLAGVAIIEVPTETIINPIATKFLDGQVGAGTLTDASLSDDIYFQLNPVPTPNPLKQKIDVILAGEYNGGGPVSSFEFRLEAAMNGGPAGDVIQTIELWNETDSIWELVDSQAASTSDSVVQVSAAGDLTRFIHPLTNEIFARAQWTSPSFSGSAFNWDINVDQFGWLIS